MKYRRKSEPVNALQVSADGSLSWTDEHYLARIMTDGRVMPISSGDANKEYVVKTREGQAVAYPGDWIIEEGGHLLVFTDTVFLERYERDLPPEDE